MRPHPFLLRAVVACLVGLAACNRPATEVKPAVLQQQSARPDDSPVVDDNLITTQVKAALAAADGINGKDIRVSTRQGEVTLTGKVPAPQIERAEEVARDVDGVLDVNNELKPMGVMA